MALYNDDIRGMIKFIQLNQDKVLDQAVWETMDELFSASMGLGPFIDHVGDQYNMEKKQIVHHYLEHIFLWHLDRVDTAFIDFVELIVHNLDNEVLIPFFIHYMTKWWNGAR
jgi:hypothetical protein